MAASRVEIQHMIETWWLDIVTLALLLCFGYLLYRLETNSIGPDKGNVPGHYSDQPQGFSLYPAKLMRQAGIRPQRMAAVYWGAKLLPMALVPLLVLESTSNNVSMWVLGPAALIGFFMADLWLLDRRRSRRREITDSLGFFISLMSVYLQSGMSLSESFTQSARFGLMKKNALKEEVALITHEIEAGLDRDVAFKHLAERTGVPELQRLAAVVGVGFRVGSPVRDSLSTQADLLNERQEQRATELVNRKSMEALLPMMLVCFPMFLMLVFFPAIVQVMDVLGLIKELF